MTAKFRLLLAWFVLAPVLASLARGASESLVRTPPELTAALQQARAGDVIVLANGVWTDLHLVIGHGGTDGAPVVIRAETPGEVILNGSSTLKLNAPHVVVAGLFFRQGAIAKGSVIELNSTQGVVRDVAIVDYNPVDFATAYYWVFFNGSGNSVERCYFKGKNNLQPLVGNALSDAERNRVAGCHFINIPFAEANGREIIRVWGAGKTDAGAEGGAYFTVEGNLFERADGEGAEIVSLKSNHNRVVGNTVVATRGCLNIRQGSHNLVHRNVILGQDRPGAQGLRMSGWHNTVTENFVSGCDYGIRVSTGEFIERALTPAYEPKQKNASGVVSAEGVMATYPQVRHLLLAGNVTVGIKGADLEVGFNYRRRWPTEQMVLLPEECVIRNNRFVRPHGGESVVGTIPPAEPPFDSFRFVPNRYEGNRLLGGRNAFAPAEAGCVSEPLPVAWSERDELAAFHVLTAQDVGPRWVRDLRQQGRFPLETDTACYRAAESPEPKREKKKKS